MNSRIIFSGSQFLSQIWLLLFLIPYTVYLQGYGVVAQWFYLQAILCACLVFDMGTTFALFQAKRYTVSDGKFSFDLIFGFLVPITLFYSMISLSSDIYFSDGIYFDLKLFLLYIITTQFNYIFDLKIKYDGLQGQVVGRVLISELIAIIFSAFQAMSGIGESIILEYVVVRSLLRFIMLAPSFPRYFFQIGRVPYAKLRTTKWIRRARSGVLSRIRLATQVGLPPLLLGFLGIPDPVIVIVRYFGRAFDVVSQLAVDSLTSAVVKHRRIKTLVRESGVREAIFLIYALPYLGFVLLAVYIEIFGTGSFSRLWPLGGLLAGSLSNFKFLLDLFSLRRIAFGKSMFEIEIFGLLFPLIQGCALAFLFSQYYFLATLAWLIIIIGGFYCATLVQILRVFEFRLVSCFYLCSIISLSMSFSLGESWILYLNMISGLVGLLMVGLAYYVGSSVKRPFG